jgi:uncharacterized membrane protein required for colicin V production
LEFADAGEIMWLDIFAVVLLVAFLALGAYRGALASGLRLLSLALSYVAALYLAPVIAGSLPLSRMLALPLAGVGVFVTAYLILGLIAWLTLRAERSYRGEGPRTPFDRGVGSVLGLARGALIVLLIGWLSLWVDALREAGPLRGLPPVGDTRLGHATQDVLETGLGYAVGDDSAAGRVTTRMLSDPSQVVAGMQGLLEEPHIRSLQEDDLFWTYVSHESYDAALNRGSFLGIAYDASLRRRLADLGLVSEEAASDPRLFRDAVREVLQEIGPRIRGLQNDPEFRKMLDDPEVIQALKAGDTLALVGHASFQRLMQRVANPSDGG